jgi:hypothetical protein
MRIVEVSAQSPQIRPQSALQRILQEPVGAQFFRADLHIHSFGGSHDVRDQKMTAQHIVATAMAESLPPPCQDVRNPD